MAPFNRPKLQAQRQPDSSTGIPQIVTQRGAACSSVESA
ncbi:hypothetical protein VTN49DRAFT_2566 [Thermomyces lanuginosus]